MNHDIGIAAGRVWTFLNEHGASSPTKIEKETGLMRSDLQRAIGWLAKEDKLLIETLGRTEVLSLK